MLDVAFDRLRWKNTTMARMQAHEIAKVLAIHVLHLNI